MQSRRNSTCSTHLRCVVGIELLNMVRKPKNIYKCIKESYEHSIPATCFGHSPHGGALQRMDMTYVCRTK